MGENEAYIRRLIESGAFNHVCSTEVDTEMAQRALESAMAADHDQTPMEADEAAYRDLLGAYARKLAVRVSNVLPAGYSLRWEWPE